MRKDERIFLKHILENIELIEKSLYGVKKEEFLNDKEKQDANLRRLEIIGEATKNLSRNFKMKHPEIPWNKIAGMRDKLIHKYFGVDLELTWDVIRKDLPWLKEKIEKILEMWTDEKIELSKNDCKSRTIGDCKKK
jgi:uncharacterized protein with HEPN domain